jgi:hypothetical protein
MNLKQIGFFCGIVLMFSCGANNNDAKVQSKESLTQDAKQKFSDAMEVGKQKIAQLKTKVQHGDLVLRSTDDVQSQVLKGFSLGKDKFFSHAGIAVIEENQIMVYHSIGGAANPKLEMIKEPFEDFCFTKETSRMGCGLFRYNLQPNEINGLVEYMKTCYANKVKFDSAFNLNEDKYMYCSEMIANGIKKATNAKLSIPISVQEQLRLKIPGRARGVIPKFEYYAIDNLHVNNFCKEIERIVF